MRSNQTMMIAHVLGLCLALAAVPAAGQGATPAAAPAMSAAPDAMAPAASVAAPFAMPAPVQLVLRQGTAVRLSLQEELSSKTARVGQRFEMRVAEDLRLDETLVIPAGTRAVGEVTRVERKGAFGKSGKLDTRVLHAELPGGRVPLTGTGTNEGAGGTAGTVAVAVVAGVFSAFVTGKSAVLPLGTAMTAYVENDTPVFEAAPLPIESRGIMPVPAEAAPR